MSPETQPETVTEKEKQIVQVPDRKRYQNPLSRGKLRNDPCPCGSGKKIKKCHGVKHALSKDELADIHEMINNFNKRFKEALEKNAKEELEKLSKGNLEQ